MKLIEVAGDKLIDQLSKEQILQISENKLLAIKLRAHAYEPESTKIKDSPLCQATSTELAKNGKEVFWLLTGGLMESHLDLSHETIINDTPVLVGFEANALLDYHSFRPYTLEFPQTIESFVKDLTTDLPLDATQAVKLLPGTAFQLIGKAKAKLSAGLTYTQGIGNVGVSADGTTSGEFTLRISRGEKNMVTVFISQILSRTMNNNIKAQIGRTMGIDELVEYKWFKKAKSSMDTLNLNHITGVIPGWEPEQKLSDYLVEKGEKPLGQFLKNYSSFYLALGQETSHISRNLVKFILDLSTDEGRNAYDFLCHFDEDKAAALAENGSHGIERIEFKEAQSIDKTSVELGFPGKKLLLSHTLRSMREGFLIYDNHLQVMKLAVLGKKTIFFNNYQELTWKGFDVRVDDQNKGRDYWRFLFKRQDAFTNKKEILRFSRFASLLNIEPIEEAKIDSYPWFTKLLTKKDNTDFLADIYFTEAGIEKIAHASKHDIRKSVFQCAEAMGNVRPGVMFEDRTVQNLLRKYLVLGLEYDDDTQREQIEKEYQKINGRNKSLIKNDALTMKKATLLVDHVTLMKGKGPSEWNTIFLNLGKAVNADFMVIIAAICNLASQDETFVSSIEIKRQKNGEVLLVAKEKGEIMSGDEMFNETQKITLAGMV